MSREQEPRVVDLEGFRQRKSDDELHAEMVKEDFQMVFFGHLAVHLAPYCLMLLVFRNQTRFSPRPRFVATLSNGCTIDFRFQLVSGGFRLINAAGTGLPRAIRSLILSNWLVPPKVDVLYENPREAAERVGCGMVECLSLREVRRSRDQVSPEDLSFYERWLDRAAEAK